MMSVASPSACGAWCCAIAAELAAAGVIDCGRSSGASERVGPNVRVAGAALLVTSLPACASSRQRSRPASGVTTSAAAGHACGDALHAPPAASAHQ